MEHTKDNKLKVRELTKYERNMLEKKREEHKTNLTRPQVVQGIEYKGEGFRCSEAIICFDDFDVGTMYSKNLKLTNVSLSFNSFKFQPISEEFAKYFEIEHTPAGRISAGIATPFKLNFFPQVRQNLDFVIEAICETGKIQIPVRCRYKKTAVELEKSHVEFGNTIIGEETVMRLKIINKGGMMTKFEFRTKDGRNISTSASTINNLSSNSIRSKIMDHNQNNAIDDIEEDLSVSYEFFNEEMSIDYNSKLDGYSEETIMFTYKPINIKKWKAELLIYFSNFIDQEPLQLTIDGESSNVPIKTQTEVIDFGICIFNSIYKEQIVFENSSKNTSKIEIISPFEVKDFIQFNPVFAFIQPYSKCTVWIKITTEEKMLRYCENYLKKGNKLSIPFRLVCSEQKIPVEFCLNLQLTSQTLLFPKSINFGTVYHGTSMVKEIEFTNKSLLPQKFIFNQKPDFIEFEPKEVPYVVLPNDSRRLNIIFKASKLQKQNGILRAKVIVGKETTKEIEIKYEANVIKLPLSFSSLSVQFPVLQPGELSSFIVDISNISFKDYIYEIQVPSEEISGLKLTPLTNVVPVEKSVKLMIEYQADYRTFDFDTYCKIANNEDNKEKELSKELQKHEKDFMETTEKSTNKMTKVEKERLEEFRAYLGCKIEELRKQMDDIKETKKRDFDADKTLSNYGGNSKTLLYDESKSLQVYRWLIPMLFKPVQEPDTATAKIFIEVQTFVKAPILFCDKAVIDFGIVPVGFKKVETITIQNKGNKEMSLLMDVLPMSSAFNFLSILKCIEPGQAKNFAISFEPINAQKFHETMKIYAENSVNITLKGESIYPEVEVHHNNKSYIDISGALVDDIVEDSFTIQNKCEFDLNFEIVVESSGTKNIKGKSPFVFLPDRGLLAKKETKNVKVIFQPDVPSMHYFARVNVHIEGLKVPKQIFIKAVSSKSQFYVKEAFDFTDKSIQSYISSYAKEKENIFGSELPLTNFVFTFPRDEQAENKIQRLSVNNLKLNKTNLEKPIEYELVMGKDSESARYFKIENCKGKVLPGAASIISIEFIYKKEYEDVPPILENIGKWISLRGELRIAGGYSLDDDLNRKYSVECRGYVDKL